MGRLVPLDSVENKIFQIRGKRVMLDKDLAELYGVETKALNLAVKRNTRRFPSDFMFQLNKEETEIWKSQIVTLKEALRLQNETSKTGRGGRRYSPYVFTEQGVAMLSSVLRSEQAIYVNIQIMRTFTKVREMLATHKELREKIEAIEKKYNQKFKIVFRVIGMLLKEDKKPKNPIGFRGKSITN